MTYSFDQGLIKDKNNRLSIVAGAISLALLTVITTLSQAFAAPVSPLVCFSGTSDGGYNGTCTLVANGAVLDTVDEDTNPNNNYAGVYYEITTLSGKLVGSVDKLSFSYDGTGAVGGSPRLSVPIDENADGTTESYLFADTQGCNTGDPNTGVLDVVTDSTCTVVYESETFVNWAAFVAAHPTYRIATDTIPFVIADQPGAFTITNVQIGSQLSAKDQCKNGGWATMVGANNKPYKNQGACVSGLVANSNAKFKREL